MSAALQQKPEIKIRLTVVAGPYAGQIFQLNKPSFTIGRGPENDVVLMNDPQISRTHARIDVVDRDLEIVNLSQKNAVIVDGQKVQKWKIVNHSGFTIGDTVFSVEYDLGQAVVSVPAARPATVHPLKAKAPPKNGVTPKKPNLQKLNKAAQPLATRAAPPGLRAQVPGISPQVQMRPPGSQANNAFANARTAAPAGGSFMRNPRLKI